MTMTRRISCRRPQVWRPRRCFAGRAQAPHRLPREADIVVIGAGAAGIAAARRDHGGEPQGDRGGGGEPDRRPLPDRRFDLRRAVRSRRALDAQSRNQSDDQAGARRGPRDHDRALGPENPHRPPQRPRRRDRGISRRAGARQPRHRRSRAPVRRLLRIGAAEGPRRLGGHGGVRARRQFLGQGSERRLRRRQGPARRIAIPRSPAVRDWAR